MRRAIVRLLVGALIAATGAAGPAAADITGGTIFLDSDIITESDPTEFLSVSAAGQGNRLMYDRRANAFVTYNAFLFNATYTGSGPVEIQVNPEFGTAEAAMVEVARFAPVIGRLPRALRTDVQTVWIHKGVAPFGGGNHNLLIHTGQADQYLASGILEETLVHEGSHTSLDATHGASAGWLAAQSADVEFISTYARDNPTREDIAETFLVWLASRHRRDRVSATLAEQIDKEVPHRLAYFDSLALDLRPVATPPPASTSFIGVGPSRLVDTRPGHPTIDDAQAGGGKVGPSSVTEVHVAGRGDVPIDATAAVLNVTVTDPNTAGYLTVYPCGSTRPNASNLNFVAGATIANAVISKIGSNGRVCVFSQATTHLVVDTTGFYRSTFTGVGPARLLDSRPGYVTVDGRQALAAPVPAGGVIEVSVGGRGGVPPGAGSAALNLTTTGSTADGFLAVYPCGATRPTSSSLNFDAGSTIANLAISKLGIAGRVCVFSSVVAHLIIDTTGYFDSGFTGVTPARLVDTRTGYPTADGGQAGGGPLAAFGVVEVQVVGRALVPVGATSAVLNVAAVDPSRPGFITVYPCGSARPTASNLNFVGGQTIANAAVSKLGAAGRVCVYSSAAAHVIVDVTGYH